MELCGKQSQECTSYLKEMPPELRQKAAPGVDGSRVLQDHVRSIAREGFQGNGCQMNIFVGNLPLELTEEELWKEFSVFGQVKSVNIMNDRDIDSGQQCGYGFVEMPLESEGTAAVNNLKGKTVKGREIQVIEALCFSGHAVGPIKRHQER